MGRVLHVFPFFDEVTDSHRFLPVAVHLVGVVKSKELTLKESKAVMDALADFLRAREEGGEVKVEKKKKKTRSSRRGRKKDKDNDEAEDGSYNFDPEMLYQHPACLDWLPHKFAADVGNLACSSLNFDNSFAGLALASLSSFSPATPAIRVLRRQVEVIKVYNVAFVGNIF